MATPQQLAQMAGLAPAPAGGSGGNGNTPSGLASLAGLTDTKAPAPVAATTTAAPKAEHGVGGFLHNLGADTEAAATGFVPGVAHMVSTAGEDVGARAGNILGLVSNKTEERKVAAANKLGAQIVHGFVGPFEPLAHGDVNGFLHNVYAHPLNPILSLATIATGGGSVAAKAGALADKAGLVDSAGTIANLGKAQDITVPGFGEKVGATDESAEPITVKQSSRNPVIRVRQQTVNALLKKLPDDTKVVGSTARAARVLKKNTGLNADRLTAASVAHSNAYSKLDNEQQAAFHLVANGVHPHELSDLLKENEAAGMKVSKGTQKVLANPKVIHLYEHYEDDPQLVDALQKGEELSNRLTQEKVDRNLISEKTAAESPYRTMRVVNGATFKEETPARLGLPSKSERIAQSEVNRLQKIHDRLIEKGDSPQRATRIGAALSVSKDRLETIQMRAKGRVEPTGLVDQPGREIPALAKELADAGRPQPFYLPMRAEVNKASRRYGGISDATTPAQMVKAKAFKGTLLSHGLLSMHDTLTPEVAKTARLIRKADLHDALMEHAVRLADKDDLPLNWSFLKEKSGQHIDYTSKIANEFEHNLQSKEPFNFKDLFSTKNKDDESIATDEQGRRLIVPDRARDELQDEVRQTGELTRYLLSKPTAAWKQLILNLRPASFVNITIGNHILGALQAPSLVSFLANYMRQSSHGGLSEALGGKISDATMEHVFPEQSYGSFGGGEGFGRTRSALNKYGVMRPTIAVENFLRKALTESWARDTPEVKAELKANGGDINAAITKVSEDKPEIRTEISRKVDAALGNYRRYSAMEQRVKAVAPFYGWYKHITRSTGRILGDHPGRALAVSEIGQEGHAHQMATLGALPSYEQSLIGLHGLPKFMGPLNGRTPTVSVQSMNPFSTDADLMNAATSLLPGTAGDKGGGDILDTVNPVLINFLQELAKTNFTTGEAITGGPKIGLVGRTALDTFGSVPQALLAKELIAPKKTPPAKLTQQDWETQLASLLGLSVKKMNLQTAHSEAKKGY